MQHKKWAFFAAAMLLLSLVLTAAKVPVASRADITRIKAKIEAGETLSPDDIAVTRSINGTTSSRIDIRQSVAAVQSRKAGTTRPSHRPGQSLDEYSWNPVAFNWVDISTDGTNTNVTGDDTNGGPFPIGFAFPFYGQEYSTVRVCCNGFISFTSSSQSWTEAPIPNLSEPNTAIYGFWDDLSVESANGQWIMYRQDANPQRLIIGYRCELRFQAAEQFDFEYILYPSGDIVLQYQSVPTNVGSCTVGIENQVGDSAVQICYDGSGTLPMAGTAYLISQPDGIPVAPTNLNAVVSDRNVTLTWTDPDHDTNGNPITPDSALIYTTMEGVVEQVGHVANGIQTFTHLNAPLGVVTYTVRAKNDSLIGVGASHTVIVGAPTYHEDFEVTDGSWAADDGWQWGEPTNPAGPGGAHSGTRVWAVGLNSNYPSDACYHLDLNLGLVVNDPAALVEFWAWYDIENPWDGVNFKVSVDGGATWELVTPTDGYPNPFVSSDNQCIGTEQAWSGANWDWQHMVLPIGQYIGQAPIFRLTFGSDPVVMMTGFYLDDVLIWGLEPPVVAPVSGVITLDGGVGDVTQVTVHASGMGNPTTHPDATGFYTLDSVLVGSRIISATLPNYTPVTLPLSVPEGGVAGFNITLRRNPPPAPTGFDAMAWGDSGLILMSWHVSADQSVDAYNIYNKIRDDSVWILRKTVLAPIHQVADTLTESGIWTYSVTAVDTNTIVPHVESAHSRQDTVLFGELPPQRLTADSYHDDRINLSWLSPDAIPTTEVFYDNGVNGIQGYGWQGTQPSFGWWVARFQGTGPVTVSRIKAYLTEFATVGDPFQIALFADSSFGPSITPRGLIDATQELPLDRFKEWDVNPPVTFNSGVFYVGIRQMTTNSVGLGGDTLTPFINNTFFYSTWGWWSTLEPSYADIPMLRAFVDGNMGEPVEVAPGGFTSVEPTMTPAARADGSLWAGAIAKVGEPAASHEKGSKRPRRVNPTTMAKPTVAEELRLARRQNVEASLHPELHVRPLALNDHGGHHTLNDPDYYVVYRDGVDYAHVPFPNVTFTDIVGTDHESSAYSYSVKAHYENGRLSGPTNTVTTSAHMPPFCPSNVSLAPAGLTQMRIQWTNPTLNADGTPCTDLAGSRIYRNGVLITPTPIPANEQQYVDVPPHNDSLYTWTVRAVDEVPNEGAGVSAVGGVIGPWDQATPEWVDISGVGIDPGIQWDDMNVGPFDLGFDFPFYGQTYNSVRICDNGFVSFTSSSSSAWPSPIPSNDTWNPNAALYAFWDDIDLSAGGQMLYYSDVALGQFVISWLNVAQWGMPGTYTFQIVINSDGSVIYNYLTIPEHGGCLVGVENEDGTEAYQLCYSGSGPFLPHDSSAVAFWRGALVYADVSGHVVLDGGTGVVTNVQVQANGIGHPSAHPATDGNFALQDVQVGNRRVLFSLAGYDNDTAAFALDTNGFTGANGTLRRSPPPIPTNLQGNVLTLARKDSLRWDISPDLLVDGYRIYRKMRDSTTWNLRLTVTPRAQIWAKDTLELDGIYQYAVTAIDNDVMNPPVESGSSTPITNLFGHLPAQMLVANMHYDSKIQLNWVAPGVPPEFEAYYDDSTCETFLGWGSTPPFGWLVAHYQGNGPVTVTKVKIYIAQWAMDNTPIQVGVFADDGTGQPTFDALGVVDTIETLPFDEFKTWTLNPAITFDDGSFYVGIRQTTSENIALGGDLDTPFINNTFFYSYSGSWIAYEPNVILIPMQRCFVIGDMGSGVVGEMEMRPAPATRSTPFSSFAKQSPTLRALEAPASAKFAAVGGQKSRINPETPIVGPVRPSTRGGEPIRGLASRRGVPPHSPHLIGAGSASHGHHNTLDDVVRYLIYRDPQTNPNPIDSVLGTIHQYDDSPLVENVPHSYYVKARYDDNGLSPASNTVANVSCNMAPAAPSNLMLTPIGLAQMRLNWTAPTTNEDGSPCVDLAGFRIYRDGQLITPTPVPGNIRVYLDFPPEPTTVYVWTVKALDEVPNEGVGVSDSAAVQSPWRQIDYAWVDISTVGQQIVNCDNCNQGPYTIGFPFTYYGNTYTTFRVSSNGFLQFGGGTDTWSDWCVPDPGSPNNMINLFSTDLNPSSTGGGQARYYSDPGNHRCTISWNNVPRSGGGSAFRMQIVLDDNDGVTLNYQTVPDASGIVGVENSVGDGIGLWCFSSGIFTPENLSSVRFWGGPRQAITGTLRHAGGSNPPLINAKVWVTGGPDTVWTSNTGQYVLPVDVGTYQLHLSHPQHCDSVISNIVITPAETDTVDAMLLAPNSVISVSSLTFVVHRNLSQQQTFTITNAGGQCPLTYSVVDSMTWLASTPATGTVNPNQNTTITVTATPGLMQPGEYHSSLWIISNVMDSPHQIHVEMDVLSVTELNGALPTVFALHPNYPNPFNPTTLLPFDVPQQSPVDIIVYNIVGQEVARPVSGVYAAGRYQATFAGDNLPSGLYLVKMRAGNFTSMGKMMLLK